MIDFSVDIVSIVTSRRTSIDSQLGEAEKVIRSRMSRDEHRSHRGLSRINPADIAAFNTKRYSILSFFHCP